MENVAKFLKQKGCKFYDRYACRIGSYPCFFEYQKGDNVIEVELSLDTSQETNPINSLLKSAADNNEISHTEMLDSSIKFYLHLFAFQTLDESWEYLEAFTLNLDEIGAGKKCPRCGTAAELVLYRLDDVVQCSCDSCYSNFEKKSLKTHREGGSYALGFLTALLGALIGSGVWFFVGQMGFFAGFAGYIIALTAFKGYEVAKAPLSNRAYLILGITIILSVLFAQCAVDIFYIYKLNSGISFFEAVRHFFVVLQNTENASRFTGVTIVGYLFSVGGLFTVFHSISALKKRYPIVEKI